MTEISLQEYCGQIEKLIEQGRYTETMSHGKHILQQYPKYVAAYRLLGKTMLEANQDEYAADMFRRVLSADPEDLLAWVALSEVHNKRNELDAALWYMERAFELSVDNRVVENELRQFYGRRDGVEPQRVQLTRGALARLYLKGDLLSRAIGEFRALLAEQPDRIDLSVALAEALWRNEQRLEAAEVCQRVLDKLPYCLKANLILGEIWTNSGREEAQAYLQRAEALDPENRMAQELFGDASPLPPKEVRVTYLEYRPPTEEERPAWMAGVEAAVPLTEREATLVDIAAALEAQIEIPAWLEEIEVGEAAVSAPLAFPEAPPPGETVPVPAEQVPEWLAEVQAGLSEEAAPIAGVETAEPATGWGIGPTVEEETALGKKEEVPEWLSELGMKPLDAEKAPAASAQEGVPDWLAELGVQPLGEAKEELPVTPGQEEVPGWLTDLGVQPLGETAGPAIPSAEQPTDWLAGLRDQFTPEEAAPVTEAAPPVAEAAAMPAWLEGEGMPSGEEAMAWLSQLAVGKEEELRAQAAVEAEVRMAEIMGRPAPAEAAPPPTPTPPPPAAAEVPEWVQELAPAEAAATPPPAAEIVPPPVEEAAPPAEAFGWAAFGEPAMPPMPVEEVAPPEAAAMPAWLEGEGMPSGEEAMAWLSQLAAGKEEELRAQAAVEAEVRMAEIMGRPAPAEAAPPPTPTPPPPAAAEVPEWMQELAPAEAAPTPPPAEEIVPPPVEEAAPSAEAFGWAAFGEPAMPPIMEAAPVEAVTPPVEEVAAPPAEAFGWAAFGEPAVPPVAEAVIPPVEEVAAPPPEVIYEPEAIPSAVEVRREVMVEEIAITRAAAELKPAAPEKPAPPRKPAPPKKAAAPPKAVPVEIPTGPFPEEQAYLKEYPRDYDAWLALARAMWQIGEQKAALEAYSHVIHAGRLLESVVPDLEEYLVQWPSTDLERVLGDAYMKTGRLEEALDLYRRALESL